MSSLVYILEDNADLAEIYRRELAGAGFTVEIYISISAFVGAVRRRRPSLSILDLELPDGNSLSVLRNVLTTEQNPVIIASGCGGLGDKIAALDSGADDYIVKPFEPLELVARVNSVLRRQAPAGAARKDASGASLVRFSGVSVDFDRYTLTTADGKVTELSFEDAKLLFVLIDARGRILSREHLLNALQSDEDKAFDRSIDVRISRLRKKLRAVSDKAETIRTVYGAGYVFVPAVEYCD